MSEILENYGGFRVITQSVGQAKVKHLGDLHFDVDINIPVKDKREHYAVDIYFNNRFVMRTNEYPIIITNEDIIKRYNNYEYMIFTFIVQRIVGNKQSSKPTVMTIQKINCAGEVLCSERTICTDKGYNQNGV